MRSDYPTINADSIGWITEEQMVEIDLVMIEELDIGLIQMMENAGRNLARLVLDLHSPDRVAIVAGSGGNGGGGMVAARHLHNAGVDVVVTTSKPADELEGVPARQFKILRRIGVRCRDELEDAPVIIDALVGYSLRGAPRGRTAELIELINASAGPVVSLDTPSGLDVTTGDAPGIVVAADQTMTLCLPKVGLKNAAQVGDLYLADISVPPSVTAPLGRAAPDFSLASVVRIV